MPKLQISEFRGDYYFLSNFYSHEVTFEGMIYPTSEHAFQASKLPYHLRRERLIVAEIATPGQAKKYGRKCLLREDWEEVKVDIMEQILRSKFSDKVLAKKLKDTDPATLIEGNYWGDKFWGVCNRTNVGLNHLGELLMKIRRTLALK